MQAQGSQLTNKYAEGYPASAITVATGGGQSRTAAIDRAKALFEADYVNVQPHSALKRILQFIC